MQNKLSEEYRKKQTRKATEWNKRINRVVVSFKKADFHYWEKWQALPGKNNLEKIKGLLDRSK